MSFNLMSKCEQKKTFKIEGKYIEKWVEVEVSKLLSGVQPHIRCLYCNGKVRVHKQQVEHGPKDHVEHAFRQDSETCKGGHYFKGDHKRSLQPVE